jgi:hypothetical protein
LLAFSAFKVLVDGFFMVFFALGISSNLPLDDSGIEHMLDPENQDVQGDGGCLGVHFRSKDT